MPESLLLMYKTIIWLMCVWPSANKDLIYWGQHITYCIEQTYADITEKINFS